MPEQDHYNDLGMIPSQGLSSEPSATLLNSLCEKPIFDFFAVLCQLQPEIAELNFATYRRRPGLSERLRERRDAGDEQLFALAEEISGHGVEFWNAVLSVAHQRGELRESFVRAALLHNLSLPERNFALTRDQVMNREIPKIIPLLQSGEGLLARSRVRLRSGETAFLPMVDFTCPCHGENARSIRKLVDLAGAPEGILVRSGRSYHFYGIRLLAEREWTRFLAFALLFAPVTDSRWVAHRLLDGEARLKIVDSDGGRIPVIEEAFAGAS